MITPREPFRTDRYTATIGRGVADLAGNPLAGDYTWSFRATAEYRIRLPIARYSFSGGW